jgi:TatD DNase family protein
VSLANPELTVKSGAVDTHCHLFLLDQEPAVVVEAAKAAGVDRLICVGVDVQTSERSISIASELEGVYATAGVHPHDADGFDDAAASRVQELLHDPVVVAVGECGLDWFRMHSEREAQIAALRAHIELSKASGKPMVVHVRDAWDDALRVLDEGSAEQVVIHCFTGDVAAARECERRGYWLSFAGNVTYPKNTHLREAAAAVTLDRILV